MRVWKFAIPTFTGDAWAAAGDQTAVPPDRMQRVYQSPIRYKAIAMTGLGPDATAVNDGTTIDISIVKVTSRPSVGDPTGPRIFENYQLTSIAENNDPPGTEVDLGAYSEVDVDPADQVAVGVRSVTQDTATAIWITACTGLEDQWAT